MKIYLHDDMPNPLFDVSRTINTYISSLVEGEVITLDSLLKEWENSDGADVRGVPSKTITRCILRLCDEQTLTRTEEDGNVLYIRTSRMIEDLKL